MVDEDYQNHIALQKTNGGQADNGIIMNEIAVIVTICAFATTAIASYLLGRRNGRNDQLQRTIEDIKNVHKKINEIRDKYDRAVVTDNNADEWLSGLSPDQTDKTPPSSL